MAARFSRVRGLEAATRPAVVPASIAALATLLRKHGVGHVRGYVSCGPSGENAVKRRSCQSRGLDDNSWASSAIRLRRFLLGLLAPGSMSVMAIFRQQSLEDTANATAFIDLPRFTDVRFAPVIGQTISHYRIVEKLCGRTMEATVTSCPRVDLSPART